MKKVYQGLINFVTAHKIVTSVGLACALILLGSVVVLLANSTQTIELRESGFVPDMLEIRVGDTVTFVNKRDTQFWPASDIHPTHEMYPEFDPREPLPPGSSWSFTFTKPGKWNFHDHLTALHTGSIVVLGESQTEYVVSECKKVTDSNQHRQCWDDKLEDAYEKGGVEESFNQFADLHSSEPEFAQDCHGFAHTLGNMAFSDYNAGRDFTVTSQVAYCSYGFFHGFMEALVFETGDYEGAREFCDYIEESLSGEISSVGPCIHGIGHGVSDVEDPRMYGKPELLIETGLKLCAQIPRTEYEEKICATGVYNAVAIAYMTDKHGFEYDAEDPYAICRDQTRPHIREACYEEMDTIVLRLDDNKLDQALPYVVAIEDDMRYRKQAVESLSVYSVYNVVANDYEYVVRSCQSLEEDELRIWCIRGLAAGFITIGTPDKEYLRALDFCATNLITEEERLHCYDRMLYAALVRYPKRTLDSICEMTPEAYRTARGNQFCTFDKTATGS